MIITQPVTSQAVSAGTTPASTGGTTALGKEDFLKLLITQLRYQDPLDPLDQNEFLSQTAQFTQLETLQNIGKQLEDLKALSSGASLTQAAALLGKTASVSRGEVGFDGVSAAVLPFTLSDAAATVDIDVLDAQGNRLRRLSVGAVAAGPNAVAWDGTDDAGRGLVAGTYGYRVAATGAAGVPAPLATVAQGTITGLQTDGARLLYRMGTMVVRSEDIVEVQ